MVEVVGSVASFETLFAVVGDSAPKIIVMRISFRYASHKLMRLEPTVMEGQNLLRELIRVSGAYERAGIPQSLLLG